MSMAYHQDENRAGTANLRRNKLRELESRSHGKQRTALGNLSNVQTTRVQPYRAAKPLTLKERHVLQPQPCDPQYSSSTVNHFHGVTSQLAQNVQPAPFSIFTDHDGSGSSNTSRASAASRTRLSGSAPRRSNRLSGSGNGSSDGTSLATSGYDSNSQSLSIPRPDNCDEAMNESAVFGNNEEQEYFASPMTIDNISMMVLETPEQKFANKVLCMRPYEKEVNEYLRKVEVRMKPRSNFMQKQPDINSNMRLILVDWLVEVTEEYKLENETLFLAVSYVDRFLSHMSVQRAKLQLLGTASMFLASKYEEIYPPELQEFVYITDDTYTKKQVLKMEMLILKVLQFDIAMPTALMFLHRFLAHDRVAQTQHGKVAHLATFLLELSLLHVTPFITHIPSIRAAAAFGVAHYVFNNELWPGDLESATGYSVTEVGECMQCLITSWRESSFCPQKAVRNKYSTAKFNQVSKLSAPAFPFQGVGIANPGAPPPVVAAT